MGCYLFTLVFGSSSLASALVFMTKDRLEAVVHRLKALVAGPTALQMHDAGSHQGKVDRGRMVRTVGAAKIQGDRNGKTMLSSDRTYSLLRSAIGCRQPISHRQLCLVAFYA